MALAVVREIQYIEKMILNYLIIINFIFDLT